MTSPNDVRQQRIGEIQEQARAELRELIERVIKRIEANPKDNLTDRLQWLTDFLSDMEKPDLHLDETEKTLLGSIGASKPLDRLLHPEKYLDSGLTTKGG